MESNQVDNKENLGTRRLAKLRMSDFPNADEIVRQGLLSAGRGADAVDVLLVNPPTPDGGYWIRTQHRVGRRTRENMVWPQVSLAQMAALLHPTYTVKVIDANAERMGWEAFRLELERWQPKYYVTQMTAPTLENDMYGCFLAHARGAKTIAFGTHVTPIPRESMRPYPSLDYALVGEPDPDAARPDRPPGGEGGGARRGDCADAGEVRSWVSGVAEGGRECRAIGDPGDRLPGEGGGED